MSQCGFWAHCAHHCDLTCDHNEWCPGFPAPKGSVTRLRYAALTTAPITALAFLGAWIWGAR